MSVNAMKEEFDVVELFGRYALFTNARIDRGTVPSGWHCYDIRGSDEDPGELAALEPKVSVNHAGTILSPRPIPFPDGQDYLDIREEIGFAECRDITLAEFRGIYGTDDPDIPAKHERGEPVPLEISCLAALKRAVKPGTELMATYHRNHPEIVGLVRVVTEVHTNGFYSKIKDQPDHEFSQFNHGRGFYTGYEKAARYQFGGSSIKVLDARKNDGSSLYEFEVYAQEMKMEEQEETGGSFNMTMGGM